MSLNILAIGFLAPGLFAVGAAAISIPIIIHLLNKRKFKIVVWAAMDFLLAAQRRNSRKLKFNRWLLLLLRCLALLFLAAGVARLVTSAHVLGGAWGEQHTYAVIWDDSYSMGYSAQNAASSFERSRKLLLDWIPSLKPTDQLLLVRGSKEGVGIKRKPTMDHGSVEGDVKNAVLTDAGTALPEACENVQTVLEDSNFSTTTREVLIVTDCSRSGMIGKENQGYADRLKHAIAALKAEGVSVRIVDVGDAAQDNTAVVALESMRSVVVANSPSLYRIKLLNATRNAQQTGKLLVSIDGVEAHQEEIGTIEPGGVREIVVQLVMPSAGVHSVEAHIPNDHLAVDDVRRLMVDARKDVPILLVDGNPGDGRMSQGSVTYLWAAYGLVLDGKNGSIFAPKRITELELSSAVLSEYPVVVLSDTAAPSESVRHALKRYVDAGGVLMLFPGDRTNPQLTNSSLGKEGVDLLPATYGRDMQMDSSGANSGGVTFAAEGFRHPVIAPFGGAYKAGEDVGFLNTQTSRYFQLSLPTDGKTETILRYSNGATDTGGDPAVVMRQIGKGRVVMFASSADTAWNSFGAKPSFVPFLYELTYYSMPGSTDQLTLNPGEHIDLVSTRGAPGMWVGPRHETVSVTSVTEKAGDTRLRSESLWHSGYYVPTGGDGRALVAVNADPDEADVRHVAISQVASVTGVPEASIAVQPGTLVSKETTTDADQHSTTWGPLLLGFALAFLIGETILALTSSRQH